MTLKLNSAAPYATSDQCGFLSSDFKWLVM